MIEWLDDFYRDPDLRSTLLDSFVPVFETYAQANGGAPPEFVQALAESYVDRHLGSSRAQLQELVKDAEDPLAALTGRFDEWDEKRPGKVATNETVRSANAIAVEQMRANGVKEKVWRTVGTCAFCREMAGRTTTIEKDFVKAGDALHPEGVEVAMTVTTPISHPPLHQGCRCFVEDATTESVVTENPVDRYGADSTEALHKVDGKWTPERQRLHDQILRDLLDGHSPQGRRQVYLTGGGPASGKGSFATSGRVPRDAAAVDPDTIKALLPEYQQATAEGQTWAAAFAHEESSYLSKRISVEATSRGLNLSLDTVGDGAIDNLANKIAALRSEGTRVVADYATCPTDTAVERALLRGQKTGRFVPESYIRESHAAISDVLPQAIERNLFDEIRLFNTESRPPRLIMQSIDGVTEIFDQDLWAEFLAKAVQT